ncbi:GIY-YIG nuclease family protein [Lyngbya aestuarii]|uniref:GIY-YIG nuclease family protein n=1 Tax=Lyngbya aestuarii TaxID=118322 RepID=UPI00403DDE06
METSKDVPIEHQNVPEAHLGLHGFLYNSEDEHTAAEVNAVPESESNSNQVLPLEMWCAQPEHARVAGVYAVLDSQQHIQYVGYSRNVLKSLESHVTQNGSETCAGVRVQLFKYPKRTEMEALRDEWLQELDTVPPGNSDESQKWASTINQAARAVMTDAERNAYEEKKLKLRKAMADTTLATESEAKDASEVERRQKLDAAVNNDDWSAIIDSESK